MATTAREFHTPENRGASPITTHSTDSSPQWAARFGACDGAKTSPGGASSEGRWGSQQHSRCQCRSAATQQIDKWQQSAWYRWLQGEHRWLSRCGVNQSSHCRGGDKFCIWDSIGFVSDLFPLFKCISHRHWLSQALREFWISQGLFYVWGLYWFYNIHSMFEHYSCSIFASPDV